MELTEEQKKILATDEDIRINAVAGSGKTTTLIEYAKSRPQNSRILYLAFNKSVKAEAIHKFQEKGISNVTVETAHSLAFKHIVIGKGFQVGFHSTMLIAQAIFKTNMPSKEQLIAATHIERFAAYFCNSTAQKVSELDYRILVEDKEELKKIDAQYDMLELNTRQYLAMMHNRSIPINHDFYLKLFQVSNPRLNYDYILFDESQDASPVMVDIIKKQNHLKRIIVGDSHQQIYSWRFAVNSMALFPYKEFSLTQSFRFPQMIADLATEVIKTKRHFSQHSNIKIIGTENSDTINKIEKRAIIGRTNISLLAEAISLIKRKKSAKIYFEGHINSYLFASEEGSLSDVVNLYNNKKEYIKDPIISKCVDLQELKEYAKKLGNGNLVKVIELVNKHGDSLPKLIGQLKNRHIENREEADYYFSTVHRCKGLEYDEVFLCSDFTTEKMILAQKDDENSTTNFTEEVNLLYVALTRTKKRLHLPNDAIPFTYTAPVRKHIVVSKDSDSMDKLDKVATKKSFYKKKSGGTHSASGMYWAKNDEAYLLEQYKNGASIYELSKKLGRSRGAIRSRLKKLTILE